MEDDGKGCDVVITTGRRPQYFSAVIDSRTGDCLKRTFRYWYSDRTKSLTDTYVFARGEVVAEEWTHKQTWGPRTKMSYEEAAKLFWESLREAKQELECEGRKIKLVFLEHRTEASDRF